MATGLIPAPYKCLNGQTERQTVMAFPSASIIEKPDSSILNLPAPAVKLFLASALAFGQAVSYVTGPGLNGASALCRPQ